MVVNITFCASANNTVYHSVTSGYLLCLFLFLLILLLLTANIPLSTFQREHLASFRAVAVAFGPALLYTVAKAFLLSLEPELSRYYGFLWLEICWTIVLVVILITLFMPAVSSDVNIYFTRKQ